MGVTAVSCLPHAPQPGTNLQPGVCSDRELNPQLFGVRDNVPTNLSCPARALYLLFTASERRVALGWLKRGSLRK